MPLYPRHRHPYHIGEPIMPKVQPYYPVESVADASERLRRYTPSYERTPIDPKLRPQEYPEPFRPGETRPGKDRIRNTVDHQEMVTQLLEKYGFIMKQDLPGVWRYSHPMTMTAAQVQFDSQGYGVVHFFDRWQRLMFAVDSFTELKDMLFRAYRNYGRIVEEAPTAGEREVPKSLKNLTNMLKQYPDVGAGIGVIEGRTFTSNPTPYAIQVDLFKPVKQAICAICHKVGEGYMCLRCGAYLCPMHFNYHMRQHSPIVLAQRIAEQIGRNPPAQFPNHLEYPLEAWGAPGAKSLSKNLEVVISGMGSAAVTWCRNCKIAMTRFITCPRCHKLFCAKCYVEHSMKGDVILKG